MSKGLLIEKVALARPAVYTQLSGFEERNGAVDLLDERGSRINSVGPKPNEPLGKPAGFIST